METQTNQDNIIDSMTKAPTITKAYTQWRLRPDDQRFETLEALKEAVGARRRESWTATPRAAKLRVVTDEERGGLGVEVFDHTRGTERVLTPTNWAFSQLSQYAGAPAQYLRKLPPVLAGINLQWGLEHMPAREDMLTLAHSAPDGENTLRAITSPSYGRIWDEQVVDSVIAVNRDGRWKIPSSSSATRNPRRATTLYASDRDVFIFLVDDQHPIEVPGKNGLDTLYRGFMTWNSETGSDVFGLQTFLYRTICDNRIIMGLHNVRELRIRHTGGAPERFRYEGAHYLRRYADESSKPIIDTVVKARNTELDAAKPTADKDALTNWMIKRGFTRPEAQGAIASAKAEEGEARSIWDIVSGITAHARTLSHADARVTLEEKAGKLLSDLTK